MEKVKMKMKTTIFSGDGRIHNNSMYSIVLLNIQVFTSFCFSLSLLLLTAFIYRSRSELVSDNLKYRKSSFMISTIKNNDELQRLKEHRSK